MFRNPFARQRRLIVEVSEPGTARFPALLERTREVLLARLDPEGRSDVTIARTRSNQLTIDLPARIHLTWAQQQIDRTGGMELCEEVGNGQWRRILDESEIDFARLERSEVALTLSERGVRRIALAQGPLAIFIDGERMNVPPVDSPVLRIRTEHPQALLHAVRLGRAPLRSRVVDVA